MNEFVINYFVFQGPTGPRGSPGPSGLSVSTTLVRVGQHTVEPTPRGFANNKNSKKSEITMEVGGWVQVSLGILLWKIVPK